MGRMKEQFMLTNDMMGWYGGYPSRFALTTRPPASDMEKEGQMDVEESSRFANKEEEEGGEGESVPNVINSSS